MRFLDALKDAQKLNKNVVIPDIKAFSPKEGDLLMGRNPAQYARSLVKAGAPVLSVVTEEEQFHGSLEMLREIADAVSVPILRKDFIHTKEDLIQTREAGASAILLMCSCLTEEEMLYLYEEALKLGIDPFVETHKAEDFEMVRKLNAKLIGINNRDILLWEKDEGDVKNTVGLASLAPKDAFLVTESSIKNPAEVRKAIAAGADAALVGTTILKAKDPGTMYKMLCNKYGMKVCGLMNRDDIQMCASYGVERMGLVTQYPVDVPWNLSREQAAELREAIPQGYQAVIVTGGSISDIIDRALTVKPDLVQLHFKEGYETMKKLSSELEKYGIGIIAKFPTTDEEKLEYFGTDDIKKIVEMICECNAQEILIDPRNPKNAAAKKLEADIELVKKVKEYSTIPVILAGGITPENMTEKLIESRADSVDIMNGSEDCPGKKSESKIRSLAEQIQTL